MDNRLDKCDFFLGCQTFYFRKRDSCLDGVVFRIAVNDIPTQNRDALE